MMSIREKITEIEKSYNGSCFTAVWLPDHIRQAETNLAIKYLKENLAATFDKDFRKDEDCIIALDILRQRDEYRTYAKELWKALEIPQPDHRHYKIDQLLRCL